MPPGAQALLHADDPVRRRLLRAQEVRLELLHPGDDEERRRVVGGRDQRVRRHAQMPALLVERLKRLPQFGRRPHGRQSTDRGFPSLEPRSELRTAGARHRQFASAQCSLRCQAPAVRQRSGRVRTAVPGTGVDLRGQWLLRRGSLCSGRCGRRIGRRPDLVLDVLLAAGCGGSGFFDRIAPVAARHEARPAVRHARCDSRGLLRRPLDRRADRSHRLVDRLDRARRRCRSPGRACRAAALTRSTEPPTLLITGSTSRSAPRISDESRSNVVARRRNAHPSPRPTATRNTVRPMYATFPYAKANVMARSLLVEHAEEVTSPEPTTTSPS